MVNQLVVFIQELFLLLVILILIAIIVSVVITIFENIRRARRKQKDLDLINQAYQQMLDEIEKEEKDDKKN